MTHTKLYLPPYTAAEMKEMRRLIDAGRYADYHAYNWIHRGRDWSRHAHNIVAGYGPDAAYVRAYLHSYFEGKLTESQRMEMSAKIAEYDLEVIEKGNGTIPTDLDAVKNEVLVVLVKKFKLLEESWPGTMTYGEEVGAETTKFIDNPEKVEAATLAGLAAMSAARRGRPEGVVVTDKGVIIDPNDEFGGRVGIETDDLSQIEKLALSKSPSLALGVLDLMYGDHDPDQPTETGKVPGGGRFGSGAGRQLPSLPLPPSRPPFVAPGGGDSRVSPPTPQSMSAPVEDKASAPALPISAPSPTPGAAREISATMPDLLHSLLPKLDGGPVFDIPGGATPDGGSMRGTNERSSATHEIEASLPETADDLGEIRIETRKESVPEDAEQSATGMEPDASMPFDAAEEALEAEIAVALTAIERLRIARSRFPGVLMDRDRNVIRLTSISATAPSNAGGPTLVSSHSEPQPAAEPPLTEMRVRQLVREGINEWDSGFGVRFRSRHYSPFWRG